MKFIRMYTTSIPHPSCQRDNQTESIPQVFGPSIHRNGYRIHLILAMASVLGILLMVNPLRGQEDEPFRFGPGEEIPIGIATLLSGEKAALGREVLDGAAAYLKDHPSVLGHPMSLVPLDDGCDETTSKALAGSFCAMTPRPVAVVGYLCSPGTLAALQIHDDCRLPLVNVSSGEPRLTHLGSPWILRVWTSRAHQGLMVCRWIRSRRLRRVLLIHEADPTSQAIVKDFLESLPKLSSRTKAKIMAADEPDPSLSEPFRGRAPPQLVYYVGKGKTLESLWGELPSNSLRKYWILDRRATLSVSGSGSTSRPRTLYSIALQLPTGDPQSPPFRYFRGRFGEPGVYTLAAYDALAVLADALERSGRQASHGVEWDPVKFMAALRKTRLQGLTGAISFDERGDRIEAYGRVSLWKGGKWELHWQGRAP